MTFEGLAQVTPVVPGAAGMAGNMGCGVTVGSRLGGSTVAAGVGSAVGGLDGAVAAAADAGGGAAFASRGGVAGQNCLIRTAAPRNAIAATATTQVRGLAVT